MKNLSLVTSFGMVNIHERLHCPFGGGIMMNATFKTVVAGIFAGLVSFASLAQRVDQYDLTMRLYVPRVYDNMQSLGYRRYQL